MRSLAIALSLSTAAFAQSPPKFAEAPRTLPPSVSANAKPVVAAMPREENLAVIDLRSLRIERRPNQLVLTVKGQVFRTFNPLNGDAEATEKLIKELAAVRWGVIGKARSVVEYGLTIGATGDLAVPSNAGFPLTSLAIDLRSVKVEAIRGAWCLRDDNGPLLNFGPERQEAEQALAVSTKYGFNRIGTVGTGPAVTYFYASVESAKVSERPRVDLAAARSGIDVPGLGFVGERIAIEPKKLEVRREGTEVTLRHGQDVIAKFGSDEWTAGDAMRVIRDGRFTEFCRFGGAGVTFFLVRGKAPTNVPFQARTNRFDPASLHARELNGKWWVMDVTAKPLLPAASESEANDLIRLIKSYGFDMTAQVGNSPKSNMQFLAKSR